MSFHKITTFHSNFPPHPHSTEKKYFPNAEPSSYFIPSHKYRKRDSLLGGDAMGLHQCHPQGFFQGTTASAVPGSPARLPANIVQELH